MAFQAGLPLDKFYSVYSGPVPRKTNGDPEPGFVFVKKFVEGSELWMKKVLLFTETELITVHNQWVGHLQAFLGENEDANECHDTMRRLSAEICEATDRYGLFNYVAAVAEVPIVAEDEQGAPTAALAGVPTAEEEYQQSRRCRVN